MNPKFRLRSFSNVVSPSSLSPRGHAKRAPSALEYRLRRDGYDRLGGWCCLRPSRLTASPKGEAASASAEIRSRRFSRGTRRGVTPRPRRRRRAGAYEAQRTPFIDALSRSWWRARPPGTADLATACAIGADMAYAIRPCQARCRAMPQPYRGAARMRKDPSVSLGARGTRVSSYAGTSFG